MDGRSQDEQLAHQCVQGDELAWRDFVDRYTPMVYSLCIHAGLGPMDAEDVCQEAMLSALRSLGTYRGCRLSTWLYRITRRRLADHFRSPQRRLVPIGLSDEPSLQRPAPCPSPVQDQELIKVTNPALAIAKVLERYSVATTKAKVLLVGAQAPVALSRQRVSEITFHADPDIGDYRGNRPLYNAVKSGDREMVKLKGAI